MNILEQKYLRSGENALIATPQQVRPFLQKKKQINKSKLIIKYP